MSVVTTVPRSHPFTRADLEAMPDDGRRHELIDGVLIVTPSPAHQHQRAQMRLISALLPVLAPDHELLAAPFDVVLADDTIMQPDLLLAPRADFTARDLPVAPLLAIEILSPSTRRIDLMLKRSRLEAAGCPHYWVVDPDEQRIVAWALHDGAYVEVADVCGDDEFTVDEPFPVRIVPSRLAD